MEELHYSPVHPITNCMTLSNLPSILCLDFLLGEVGIIHRPELGVSWKNSVNQHL